METTTHTKNVLFSKFNQIVNLKVDIVLILIIISICCGTKSLEAQSTKKIDSLETILNSNINTAEKYNTLAKLWGLSINTDIGKSMDYADALIKFGLEVKTDSITFYGYERKAVTHSYKNEFDSSGVYFRKALSYYTNNKAFSKIANIQRNIGQDHNLLQSLDSAYYYYDLAEKNFLIAKDTVGVGDIYNSKAVLNLQKGFFNIALDYGIKSAKIFEDNNNQLDLHQTYLPIASCYRYMNDTIKALEYYDKTATFFKKNDYLRQYISVLILSSELYNSPKTIDKGFTNINEAIEVSEKLQDFSRLGASYQTKSELYLTQGKTTEALYYIDKAVEIALTYKDSYALCTSYSNKAKIYLKDNDLKNAIFYGKKALDLPITADLLETKMAIQLLLSESFEKLNDKTQALKYYKLYQENNTKLYNSDKSKQIEELRIIYETEQREKELLINQSEIKDLKQKEEIAKTKLWLLGIIISSLIFIGGLLFYSIRQKMKRHKVEREKLDNSLQF
ncbi:MAG: tetratricopeptide repeat protein, partial [Winogradskyella sp.]|nr:tetratricopeptide repeat protein [Winogradskyella sp.]